MQTHAAPYALLSGWGRYPRSQARVVRPERVGEVQTPSGKVIARGQGRSYGDASLNGGQTVILTERLNRLLSFDSVTGVLQAEAGTTLGDILTVFVPRGWFLPTTPGTKFVSLGGAVATDVHGKNHHRDGSFSNYVQKLRLMLADGSVTECSPTQDPELFWATVGGMGLTGIILEVTVRLVPIQTAYIKARNYAAGNLAEALQLLADPAADDHHSVCWLDTTRKGDAMGQGIVMVGHHASVDEMPFDKTDKLAAHPHAGPRMPVVMPLPALNPLSIQAFNWWYAGKNSGKEDYVCHYDSFFYPLDFVKNWNLLYGPSGLLQYQFVVPAKDAEAMLSHVVLRLQRENLFSFLTILKRMGPEGKGYLSFPREGFTLTLDIPLSGNAHLFTVLDELDQELIRAGGRVYLAKDSRMRPDAFAQMYPRLPEWWAVKQRVDPDGVFTSDLSRRLGLA